MNALANDNLAVRIEQLERENRRLKRGALAALAVVGGLVLMGQATGPTVSDEVRTRKLVVVDEAGKESRAGRIGQGRAPAAVVRRNGERGDAASRDH
jgi:hypothetical protein